MGPCEHESGDEIDRAGELEPVVPPDGEVGLFAELERADVVAPEHGRTAAGRQAEGVPCGQRRRSAPPTSGEQRLLDLEEEIAALVRGRAVDAEADPHARVDEV